MSSDRGDKSVLLQFKAHIQAQLQSQAKGCFLITYFPAFLQGRGSHNAARQTLTLGLWPYLQNNINQQLPVQVMKEVKFCPFHSGTHFLVKKRTPQPNYLNPFTAAFETLTQQWGL